MLLHNKSSQQLTAETMLDIKWIKRKKNIVFTLKVDIADIGAVNLICCDCGLFLVVHVGILIPASCVSELKYTLARIAARAAAAATIKQQGKTAGNKCTTAPL